jgi:hypothetical protein
MPHSIKQQGGVKAHILKLGFTTEVYAEFDHCMKINLRPTTIANILRDMSGKPITRHGVKNWARAWHDEQSILSNKEIL